MLPTNYLFTNHIYLIYIDMNIYKQDLTLNNLQVLICHKTHPTNQPSLFLSLYTSLFFFYPISFLVPLLPTISLSFLPYLLSVFCFIPSLFPPIPYLSFIPYLLSFTPHHLSFFYLISSLFLSIYFLSLSYTFFLF